jgi:hypothetical protein
MSDNPFSKGVENKILIQNINTQVEHLLLRFDNLITTVESLCIKVDNLDKRLPHRKQGLLGGYWECNYDDAEQNNK